MAGRGLMVGRPRSRRGAEEAVTAPPAPAPAPVAPGRPSGGRPLGELLVDAGHLTTAQVDEALLQQPTSGKRLGVLLVELGAVGERDLYEVLSIQLGVPLVDLRQAQPQADALAHLPEDLARATTAIPLRIENGRLIVALADPLDTATQSKVAAAAKVQVGMMLAPPSDIRRAIDSSYRAIAGVGKMLDAFEVTESLRRVATPAKGAAPDDAPVVRVVNLMITQALRDRASDIHIEPQDGRIRVRYRIDGALHDVLALPDNIGPALTSRLKVMAGMNIVERRKPQDGQIATEVDGHSLDIRVNTTPTIWGEKAVLRLLDRRRSLLELQDLGMPADTQEQYDRLVRAPFGMVICAGPTGSGKTTTLYATLARINQTEVNITTIEDPVEYVFPSINQIQINEQAGISFSDGLRAILRQDPDVILVGEIRDVETARLAVQSSLTGHLVLSSLHATDAASALHRFVDMGIESFLIASSVSGVVSQRLVRRICDNCRAEYKPTSEELAFFERAGGADKDTFWHGEGCNFCSRTGYLERVGVYELLRMTDDIKKLVIANAQHEDMRAAAVAQGMRTLLQEGIRLVTNDLSTITEIMRSIYVI
jgi:type IV pilus assembly protein PilB